MSERAQSRIRTERRYSAGSAILASGIRGLEFITGSSLTPETFASNTLVIDAVVRNFTVIGEAARNLPAEVETRYSGLPWSNMRGMRNVVVHAYFDVDAAILWETARHDLPPLTSGLRQILEDHPS
jgi:uncharacterized protein with HEPN domain